MTFKILVLNPDLIKHSTSISVKFHDNLLPTPIHIIHKKKGTVDTRIWYTGKEIKFES